MHESGMNRMELTPEIVRRFKTRQNCVAPTSDLDFRAPSFVIRPAGVYSELGQAGLVAHGERHSLLAPLIRNSDAFKEGTVDAMTEPANESPPDDRAVALQLLAERRSAWNPTPGRASATAKSAERAFELSGQEWPSPALH